MKILFVCCENSNRSQMAEAFARMKGEAQVEVFSAGYRSGSAVSLKAISAMQELGYDLRLHRPKSLSEIPNVEFDVAVTMGCRNECPVLNAKVREDWDIPVPKEMPAEQFRLVRDQIGERVNDLLARLPLLVENAAAS